MKALTLTQPWASLVAYGAKRIETRSWSTPYRGPLAIHAAKGFPRPAQAFAHSQAVVRVTMQPVSRLPRGAVVATCQLTDCLPVNDPLVLSALRQLRHEVDFGDYAPGRWAWFLSAIHRLEDPIPATGHLSLWEFDTDASQRSWPGDIPRPTVLWSEGNWTVELHRQGDRCGALAHGPESCFPYALLHRGLVVGWYRTAEDAQGGAGITDSHAQPGVREPDPNRIGVSVKWFDTTGAPGIPGLTGRTLGES